jgi:hypothetical protein
VAALARGDRLQLAALVIGSLLISENPKIDRDCFMMLPLLLDGAI